MTLEEWKNLLDAIQAGATTLGLAVAAVWTYLLFVKRRQRFPRAQLRNVVKRTRNIGWTHTSWFNVVTGETYGNEENRKENRKENRQATRHEAGPAEVQG